MAVQGRWSCHRRDQRGTAAGTGFPGRSSPLVVRCRPVDSSRWVPPAPTSDPWSLGASVSPVHKMLSMWVRRTPARCRVAEALGSRRRAWSATDYGVPAPWPHSQHEYGERPGRRPTQMPRPQAGTKGRGWHTVSTALVTAIGYKVAAPGAAFAREPGRRAGHRHPGAHQAGRPGAALITAGHGWFVYGRTPISESGTEREIKPSGGRPATFWSVDTCPAFGVVRVGP